MSWHIQTLHINKDISNVFVDQKFSNLRIRSETIQIDGSESLSTPSVQYIILKYLVKFQSAWWECFLLWLSLSMSLSMSSHAIALTTERQLDWALLWRLHLLNRLSIQLGFYMKCLYIMIWCCLELKWEHLLSMCFRPIHCVLLLTFIV